MVRDPIPRLFALLGDPVAGNPTQEIVEDAFRRLGLDWRYVTMRVRPSDLPAAIAGLRALGFAGVHLTVPHKVAVVPLVDQLSPAAVAIGAVNCIVAHDAHLVGENTDGKGFVSAVAAVTDVAGARVVIVGAGGAARAIAVELALAGASEIRLVNRDPERRGAVARTVEGLGVAVSEEAWPDRPLPLGDATIVVNTTTIGMTARPSAGEDVPIDWAGVPRGLVAADVVIEPSTRFVAAARAVGATVVTGLDMLVEQAVLSIELWTGLTPDRTAIRAILDAELSTTEGVAR